MFVLHNYSDECDCGDNHGWSSSREAVIRELLSSYKGYSTWELRIETPAGEILNPTVGFFGLALYHCA